MSEKQIETPQIDREFEESGDLNEPSRGISQRAPAPVGLQRCWCASAARRGLETHCPPRNDRHASPRPESQRESGPPQCQQVESGPGTERRQQRAASTRPHVAAMASATEWEAVSSCLCPAWLADEPLTYTIFNRDGDWIDKAVPWEPEANAVIILPMHHTVKSGSREMATLNQRPCPMWIALIPP